MIGAEICADCQQQVNVCLNMFNMLYMRSTVQKDIGEAADADRKQDDDVPLQVYSWSVIRLKPLTDVRL